MFEFTFLGTSSGVPSLKRNVSGLAVRTTLAREWFLVDVGEASQHQLLKLPLSLHNLAGVFITHAHGDHIFGLPGLLSSMVLGQRQAPLTLWGPQVVLEWVEHTLRLTDATLPFELICHATEEKKELIWNNELRFFARPLRHRTITHAFEADLIVSKRQLDIDVLKRQGVPQGPLWGALQRGEAICINGNTLEADAVSSLEHFPARAIFGGDNADPKLLRPYCDHLQVLVHEATFSALIAEKLGPAPMHSSVKSVARFASEAAIPNLVLTHFSPRHHPNMAALRDEAHAQYSGNLILAEDCACYGFDGAGRLRRI